MQLYWKNTDDGGEWVSSNNWYEDAAATSPHGALPSAGDSVSYATGESGPITIGGGDSTILNLGTCDMDGVNFGGQCTVNGGTFSGSGITNGGTINGGTFNGSGFSNHGYIYGGTFSVSTLDNEGQIYGGTFSGSGLGNSGSINDGTFTGSSLESAGAIYGGTFSGDNLTSTGTISGGTYSPAGTVAYSALVVAGLCTYSLGTTSPDPGFARGGGTYSPQVTVTGLPVASEILGAGLL